METLRLLVEIDVDGDVKKIQPALMDHINHSLLDDFGSGAWGGYDGPIVRSVTTMQVKP